MACGQHLTAGIKPWACRVRNEVEQRWRTVPTDNRTRGYTGVIERAVQLVEIRPAIAVFSSYASAIKRSALAVLLTWQKTFFIRRAE